MKKIQLADDVELVGNRVCLPLSAEQLNAEWNQTRFMVKLKSALAEGDISGKVQLTVQNEATVDRWDSEQSVIRCGVDSLFDFPDIAAWEIRSSSSRLSWKMPPISAFSCISTFLKLRSSPALIPTVKVAPMDSIRLFVFVLLWLPVPHLVGQEAMIEKGKKLLFRGRFDEARGVFTEARMKPHRKSFFDALVNQAQAQRETGERRQDLLKRAARSYEAAIERQPNYAPALNNLARIRVELGEFDKAKRNYEKAIRSAGSKKAEYSKNFADAVSNKEIPDQSISREMRVEVLKRNVLLARQQTDAILSQHHMLMDLFADRDQCMTYLWDLADQGKPRIGSPDGNRLR